MSSIAAYNVNDPYEQLISSMISIESQPKYDLVSRRTEAERMKGVLKDVDSKLSALHTEVKAFTDPLADVFGARAAPAAPDAFTVSGGDEASLGSHTLEVVRLASADTRVSQQFSAAGTSLRGFFDANGAQTFTIGVASPTDVDPDNRVDVSITVDPTGATDEEILGEIRTAVDDAMRAAVENGDIEQGQAAAMSLVNETSDTARLSLRSGQTGYANRLTFGDSGAGLLALLEVDAAHVVTEGDTGGGQMVDVGTSELDSTLNSKFVLDGLTLYRSSNTVADALDSVTINLRQTSDAAESFAVENDTDAIKKKVTSFINKYNDVLKYLTTKSKVDGEAGTRGDLAGDGAFTSLRFNMRNDLARAVGGQPADGPQSLTELGIEINKDGTLKLADEEQLFNAVATNASAVSNLFAGSDGVAQRLEQRLDAYLGSGGIMQGRQDAADSRIKRLKNQIDAWDSRLSRREDQLRDQFARMQEAIAVFQGQQQTLSNFYVGGYY